MLWRTFIDDSSDQKQELVMLAGALMGTQKDWNALNREWWRRLKQDGLSYSRSAEYNSLRGEFYIFRDPVKYPKPKGSEAARQLRADRCELLRKHQILGLAAV